MLYRQLIAWPWIIWGLYWLISAAGTKHTERRESLSSRLTHVVPLTVGGVLIGWNRAPWGWLQQHLWSGAALPYVVGLAMVCAGLAFAVWARVHLGRNWSGAVTVKEGHELIRSGPYALVRHPIYTGLLAAVLGTAIASANVSATLGFAIITASILRKLHREEVFMDETFPGEYERYRQEVPTLIPFTKPRRSARR
jgi:protein-S-isoprenylcysteine O-methyltransferase Ste14